MNTARNQTGHVSHVDHQDRINRLGNLGYAREIIDPRVGRSAHDDHLGPVLMSYGRHRVVVDLFSFLINAVRDELKPASGDVHR